MILENWDARVERVDNGYVVYLSGDDPNSGSIAVCENDDDDELKSFESVLWELMEHFGVVGNRHDKERLSIVRVPGDKYEDGKGE